jgi:predicted PurR-regulated permease PerM
MEKGTRRLRQILLAFGVGLIVFVILSLFAPFFTTILASSILAVLLYPVHLRLSSAVPSSVAALLLTLAAGVLIAIPVTVLIWGATTQIGRGQELSIEDLSREGAVRRLETWARDVDRVTAPMFENLGQEFSFTEYIEENRPQMVQAIGRFGQSAGLGFGSWLIKVIISLVLLFFLLRDSHRLREPVLVLLPLSSERSELLLVRLAATIRAVFIGFILLAFVQAAIAGVLYYALGAPHFMVWTLLTLILCMIPVFNAPIVFVPMGIYFLVNGEWVKTLILYGVGFGVISVIDNLLRPIIISKWVQMHPLAIFFALVAGIYTIGPLGIMAGPMLLTTALIVIEELHERVNGVPHPEPASA